MDEDTDEYQDDGYFSFWDLWVGVGSQVAEDIAYALWLECLTGTLSKNISWRHLNNESIYEANQQQLYGKILKSVLLSEMVHFGCAASRL